MWILPLGLLLLTVGEVGLFVLSNKKFHPWHEIVSDTAADTKQNPKETNSLKDEEIGLPDKDYD